MLGSSSHSALADLLTRAASSALRKPHKPHRALSPLEILMHTGLRSGEIITLKWKQVRR